MYYIYEIKNFLNGKTYIGQHKTNNLNDTYKGSGNLINRAYRKYGIENFQKSILAITETKENVNILEKVFIKLYREEGKAEYNLTNGGDGGAVNGHIVSQETREKISQSGKGKHKNSKETLEKISKAHKGIPMSEEQKIKISKANTGKRRTSEQRKRMSESAKGRIVSQETKEKLSRLGKGRIVSQETREKLRKANLGRKMTEEDKRKMSEKAKLRKGEKSGMFGKHHSQETREKLRKANLGRKKQSCSDETKEKISNSNKGRFKNMTWILINGKRTWINKD